MITPTNALPPFWFLSHGGSTFTATCSESHNLFFNHKTKVKTKVGVIIWNFLQHTMSMHDSHIHQTICMN